MRAFGASPFALLLMSSHAFVPRPPLPTKSLCLMSQAQTTSEDSPKVPAVPEAMAKVEWEVPQAPPPPAELGPLESEQDAATTYALHIGASSIPHPDKSNGGEDSYFVLPSDVGVLDGVGGWRSLGYDPSVFTNDFARRIAANITWQRASDVIRVDLSAALSHADTTAEGIGTCTACLASFNLETGRLYGLNLGDSGAMLLRKDEGGELRMVEKTQTQQHRFNLPFQLGTNSSDDVEMADPFLFDLQDGDVVLLATDGVLDNMFDDDIADCLRDEMERKPSSRRASAMAKTIAERAFNLSIDPEREGPWQRSAARARRRWGAFSNFMRKGLSATEKIVSDEFTPQGGKKDDITVICCLVQRQKPPVPD